MKTSKLRLYDSRKRKFLSKTLLLVAFSVQMVAVAQQNEEAADVGFFGRETQRTAEDFALTGRFDLFTKLDKEAQTQALIHMLAIPSWPKGDTAWAESRGQSNLNQNLDQYFRFDRRQILESFFSNSDLQYKDQIIGSAFVLSLKLEKYDNAIQLLSQYARYQPHRGTKWVCEYLMGQFAPDYEASLEGKTILNVREESVETVKKMLIPLLAQRSDFLEQRCTDNVYDENQVSYTAHELMGKAVKNFDQLYAAELAKKIVVAASVVDQNSFCNKQESQQQFEISASSLTPHPAPVMNILVYQTENCRIHGFLIKHKEGFEFQMNKGLPGAVKANITGPDIASIIQQFLKTQAQQKGPQQAKPIGQVQNQINPNSRSYQTPYQQP